MQFSARLHDLIRAGIVTTSIRVWKSRRVKVGSQYRLGNTQGFVEVLGVKEMQRNQITEKMALDSGFDSLQDLFDVAQHGTGKRVFLITFAYHDGL